MGTIIVVVQSWIQKVENSYHIFEAFIIDPNVGTDYKSYNSNILQYVRVAILKNNCDLEIQINLKIITTICRQYNFENILLWRMTLQRMSFQLFNCL